MTEMGDAEADMAGAETVDDSDGGTDLEANPPMGSAVEVPSDLPKDERS
jgi:hypothetical protein